MKEQILHLDPHDDYHSARDKMGWAQTQRVLLVWPPRGRVLARRLDLLLLHRHAHRLGAHLAIITTDPQVRRHAGDLGLPVFASVEASRRARWRSRTVRVGPERRPLVRAPKPPAPFYAQWPIPAWLLWIFKSLLFALGLAALAALAYALVPSATIHLTPAPHPLSLTVHVIADPHAETITGTIIPARLVRAEVEANGHLTTTGLKDVPSDSATGTVIFTNLVGAAAVIPQGLGLRTTSGQAIRFVTTQPASLPGRFGATAEVPVRALASGPEGNVSAGQINAIDGPLGLQLAVTNPAATSGGALTQRYAVSDADQSQLRAELLAHLQQTARDTIAAQLQPGEFLAADSVQLADIVAETYSHAAGEVTDILTLTLRISATGLRVSDAEARQVAQDALTAAVPSSEVLLPADSRFERDPLNHLDADGRVHFDLTATGTALPLIDAAEVRQAVAGQTLPAALARLTATLPLAEAPRIALAPRWWAEWYNRLPELVYQIKVNVQPNP